MNPQLELDAAVRSLARFGVGAVGFVNLPGSGRPGVVAREGRDWLRSTEFSTDIGLLLDEESRSDWVQIVATLALGVRA